MFASQLIQRGVKPARLERLACFDLLTALPPLGVSMREDILRGWLRRPLLLIFLGFVFQL